MAISLSSISQLSAISGLKDETNFLQKYSNILGNNITAEIEISYNNDNTLHSFKLDFKDVLNTLYTDLYNLLCAISTQLSDAISQRPTQTEADNDYVHKKSDDIQTILSPLTFIGSNDQKIEIKYYDAVKLTNTNLDVYRSSSTGSTITYNSITTTNITATGKADLTAEHAKWS